MRSTWPSLGQYLDRHTCLGICQILLFELSLLFLDVVIDFSLLGKTLEDLTLRALCGLKHFIGSIMLRFLQ